MVNAGRGTTSKESATIVVKPPRNVATTKSRSTAAAPSKAKAIITSDEEETTKSRTERTSSEDDDETSNTSSSDSDDSDQESEDAKSKSDEESEYDEDTGEASSTEATTTITTLDNRIKLQGGAKAEQSPISKSAVKKGLLTTVKALELSSSHYGGDGDHSAAPTSDEKEKQGKRRKRKRKPLTICLTHCRYELVREMSRRYSLVDVPETATWNVYWTDYSVSLERAVEMRRFQVVNHFPGMNEICRKDLLARNLNRMKRVFPEDYNIYPMTWCLPADNLELQSYSAARRGKTFICKPEMGCQGRGIFLLKNIKDVNPLGRIICQIYIQKPFLIDHLKFDLRIYVLITSCDPLRIYYFEEGLARFATAKYKLPTQTNTENSYMHLTNYAVNKFSKDFVVDEDTGTKRKLTNVMAWLQQRGYDVEHLQKEMDDVIIKTILSAQPTLKHHYRTCFPHHDVSSACFEILGFDILIDHKLKPFVIEVNHSPSFHTDTDLDREIKEGLLNDTFAMLNLKTLERGQIEREDRRRVQERITNSVKLGIESKKDTNSKPKPGNSKKETGVEGSSAAKNEGEGANKERPPRKDMTKEDFDDVQFEWELENRGRFRLIYPTAETAKYDKFLIQNQVSLFQETAASQARANLTKQKMDEYYEKKQIEEQKRSLTNCSIGKDDRERPVKASPSKSKEKVRPEDGGRPTEVFRRPRPVMLSPILPTNPSNGTNRGFTSCYVIHKEECDRMKGLIQRGLLIKNLGIDLQVYQILCKVGTLKKQEHDEFRRKNGYILPNTGGLIPGYSNPLVRPGTENSGSFYGSMKVLKSDLPHPHPQHQAVMQGGSSRSLPPQQLDRNGNMVAIANFSGVPMMPSSTPSHTVATPGSRSGLRRDGRMISPQLLKF